MFDRICVARTRNGLGSGWVSLSTVICDSFIASSKRGVRFRRGSVDFVSDNNICEDSARLEFEALRRGVVDADADHVARQHVGCELMRWNEQRNERASAWARVVLPTPGTSSMSRWPRASRVVSASWITSSLPFTTREIVRSSSASLVLAAVTVAVIFGVSGAIFGLDLWADWRRWRAG